MTKLMWHPSTEAIKKTNIKKFMGSRFNSYDGLYQWSINNPDKFWLDVWNFCGIQARKKPIETIYEAELNFAENLLRFRDQHTAIISYDENGLRNKLTYEQLYQKVAAYAAKLREIGIKKGDRVAGFLPNNDVAVIAMLATTSIGAIWSSCSLDFGINGALERFEQIEPKLLFVSNLYSYNGKQYDVSSKITALKQRIPSITHVIQSDEIHLETPTKINFEPLPFKHPLYIMYSSGTTGKPKCIVHGAGGTLVQHLKELVLHTDLKRDDTIFYYTTTGWMMWNWLVSSLAVGATLVLYDGSPIYPNANRLFDLIDQENISVFGVSANYLSAIEKEHLNPIKTHKLEHLRTLLSTGSTLLPSQFDYVYKHIKKEVCLSSISGGTDIISCFALGNPILPVYRGELQCRGLGMDVKIFDDTSKPVKNQKGELVCTANFPSMPICFWNDPNNKKYHAAYFEKFPGVWAHGDYAELTKHNGLIMHGRSDATLNPGGIRIGTAEIYRQTEKFNEIIESIAVEHNASIILFVKLREKQTLSNDLIDKIKQQIRENTTPRHVPAKIIQVPDIPRTMNGKIAEIAVRKTLNKEPIQNTEALANPNSLKYFKTH